MFRGTVLALCSEQLDQMQPLDTLLCAFVEQRRMKIAGEYRSRCEVVA